MHRIMVLKGESFDYRGVVFYEIEGGAFRRIDVSYLSFSRTDADGVSHSLGIPH